MWGNILNKNESDGIESKFLRKYMDDLKSFLDTRLHFLNDNCLNIRQEMFDFQRTVHRDIFLQ